jgi:hypothetical protein
LRGDTSARIAYYSAGRRDGWLNVDEIREKEELGPLPDGQGQTYLETPTGASPNPTDTPPEPTMNPDDTGMASLPLVAAHELEAPNGVAR